MKLHRAPWWSLWEGAWRRWSLWTLLVALVASMLVTLVWLAGRYEASQVQARLDRNTADAVSDIQAALSRNVQSLLALQSGDPALLVWEAKAGDLLRQQREMARIEWRDAALRPKVSAQTPYRPPLAELRGMAQAEITLACTNARRLNGPAYSGTYFQPRGDGTGSEMIELCLPLSTDGRLTGYLVVSYGLQDILTGVVAPGLTHSQEASFTEADGTRLAVHTATRRGLRQFTAQQLLDLPGFTLVLRVDHWHTAPSLFPNVLTALVTAMSIALVTVMVVLVRDNRRRLRAESDLADALAFRKAMEDSLVTGLRARDLEGRITYVNPAFCDMVGFSAQELLGQSHDAPYWPPELSEEYRQRQARRIAGVVPPREGFESVFMRKDGSRFPVLIIEAPLINAQGQHSGWMSAFLDISEQRRIEELSRASQERLQATARLAMVGEMASLLSHELNQPLAAIASYATGSLNLLEHCTDPPDAAADCREDLRMALGQIARQAERAGKVIKSVHDFVRRRDQTREAVHPQVLLDAILPLVRLQARKLDVRLDFQVDPNVPAVWCDPTMVEQVLLNLARNAMQAMDDPAISPRILHLRVRPTVLSSQIPGAEFAVADEGSGIPEDVAQRLFTPFFTTRAEGMGLGLSLCRTVVEQHGGTLTFASRQPRGTVFTFTLPAALPPTD